jgi:hypothetical protein
MLRLILVFLVIAMIVRGFIIAGLESREEKPVNKSDKESWKFRKGVPKWLGEYVDYEEIENKKR